MSPNPFKPSAGANPPLLVGRQETLEEWRRSLDDGPGAPGRITVYTGGRGVGKTVMLNEIREIATGQGWLVIDETATAGFVNRLHHSIADLLSEYDGQPSRRVTGVTLPMGLGGVELTPEQPPQHGQLRGDLTKLLTVLAGHETGLLVTVDEIHRGAVEELRNLAAITQHMIRENREFAVAMAGLPEAVSSVLSDEVMTFLRRADTHTLVDVDLSDVARALRQPIIDAGRSIDPDALQLCAAATGGYPFLIQLVGYHVWAVASDQVRITRSVAVQGIESARRRFGSLVQEPALADLSDIDRTFLAAMAVDDEPSRMGDIARRLGVNAQYANVYRTRLIKAEMIHQPRHGFVDFSLPYLRQYLRDHAATMGTNRSIGD